jgi:hypothetical protein
MTDVTTALTQSRLYDCKDLCTNSYACTGFTENIVGGPRRCFISTGGIVPNQYLGDLSPWYNESTRAFTPSCYHQDTTCIVCPDSPADRTVTPGYTLVFGHPICNTSEYRSSITVVTNNIKLTGTVTTNTCPFVLASATNVHDLTIDNLIITCRASPPPESTILITKTQNLALKIQNLTTEGATASIVLIGGNVGTPTWFDMNLYGSIFSNIINKQYPNSAMSASNIIGDVKLTDFLHPAIFALQPRLNPAGTQNVWTSTGNTISPSIINISAYTSVFGAEYETAFYHIGAFEPSAENAFLRQLVTYQLIALLFSFALLIILHQDIFFYFKKIKEE